MLPQFKMIRPEVNADMMLDVLFDAWILLFA
jgi:hypothetical protein